MKDGSLSNDYKLNINELKKATQEFIDMTYRKKEGKIYYIDN